MTTHLDEELDSRVAALPRSVEPPRDLWPDIGARLSAPVETAALPQSVEPSRELWSGIAARLTAPVDTRALPTSIEPPRELWGSIERRARGRSPRGAAGIAALVAIAAALLLWLGVWPGGAPEEAPMIEGRALAIARAPVGEERPDIAPVEPELVPGERDMLHAMKEMRVAYDQRRRLLDPTLVATVDESLVVVDDAIERSRSALVEEPSDAHLQRTLGHAYRHKLSLLQRATTPGGSP